MPDNIFEIFDSICDEEAEQLDESIGFNVEFEKQFLKYADKEMTPEDFDTLMDKVIEYGSEHL